MFSMASLLLKFRYWVRYFLNVGKLFHPHRPSLPRMAREEVFYLHRHLPTRLAMHFAAIGVVFSLFWRSAPLPWLITWGLLFMAWWLVGFIHQRRLNCQETHPDSVWRRARYAFNIGSLSASALWGWAFWVLYPHGDFAQQIVLIIIFYIVSMVAVADLSTQPAVFLVFLGLCMIPLMIQIITIGQAFGDELVIIMLMMMSIMVLLSRNHRQTVKHLLNLKVKTDDLLHRLEHEKRLAQGAQQAAESANRSKTQFFAAVSHDLRQPLQAMALFVEAMKKKNLDPDLARLLCNMDRSVSDLSDMFSELLDISQLDAGIVSVVPQNFAIGHIFSKLNLSFRPVADEKGLELRFRGGQKVVHADPILVERILFNLVSNAIRYTSKGTILVSARSHLEQVLLQVWDTGVGLSPVDQTRVFEEFYRVLQADSSVPEAEPLKGLGLGLGLSIVQRLAQIMQAPLHLRSQQGQGSIFGLSIPSGRLPSLGWAIPQFSEPFTMSLQGRLLVLVTHDASVQSSFELWLRQWGAQLMFFEGWATVEFSAFGQAKRLSGAPDVLIIDNELDGLANSLDVIKRFRQYFGAPIPVITLLSRNPSDHLAQISEHDVHTLIKPVAPSQLRAMLSFKLRKVRARPLGSDPISSEF